MQLKWHPNLAFSSLNKINFHQTVNRTVTQRSLVLFTRGWAWEKVSTLSFLFSGPPSLKLSSSQWRVLSQAKSPTLPFIAFLGSICNFLPKYIEINSFRFREAISRGTAIIRGNTVSGSLEQARCNPFDTPKFPTTDTSAWTCWFCLFSLQTPLNQLFKKQLLNMKTKHVWPLNQELVKTCLWSLFMRKGKS